MTKGFEPTEKIKKENKQICIFGATSHIAKNLIYYFTKEKGIDLILFTRQPEKVRNFINTYYQKESQNFNGTINITDTFLAWEEYDCIINCIGVGKSPKSLFDYFYITETYDNLILNYLEKFNNCKYINFSSGVVENQDFFVDAIEPKDYYAIAKLNQETKHRCLKNLEIIDLRLYSFFSRFADLEKDNYFINQIIKCIKDNTVFITNKENIVRDFIHPEDLYKKIKDCIDNKFPQNYAETMGSSEIISKNEIIEFFKKEYNLKVEYEEEKYSGFTGNKFDYTPNIYENHSKYSSLETIKMELKYII